MKSLQSLRLIFAILIYLHHFPLKDGQMFPAGGPLGVCFFIVLSGFVMSFGYGQKVMSDDFIFKEYIKKRLVRLWPLHLLCLLLYIIIHRISLFSIRNDEILCINALMLQSWIPNKEYYFSGNAVSWCLCDLMFCYACFPLLYKFVIRLSIKRQIVVVSLIVVAYLMSLRFIPPEKVHAYVYISPLFRIIDFIIGILAYNIYEKLRDGKAKIYLQNKTFQELTFIELGVVTILIMCIILFPFLPKPYGLVSMWWPICFIIIVIFSLLSHCKGGVVSAVLQNKKLEEISAISYTFYMVHTIVIFVVHNIICKITLIIPVYIEMIICFCTIMIISWIINEFFEKPVTDFLKKRVLRSTVA